MGEKLASLGEKLASFGEKTASFGEKLASFSPKLSTFPRSKRIKKIYQLTIRQSSYSFIILWRDPGTLVSMTLVFARQKLGMTSFSFIFSACVPVVVSNVDTK